MLKIIISLLSLCTLSAQAAGFAFATHTKKPISTIVTNRMVAACKSVGLTCTVSEMSGKRALSSANSGEMDGDATRVAKLKKIAPGTTGNLMKLAEPIINVSVVVITKEATKINGDISWETMNNYKISYLRGSKLIDKNIKDKSKKKAVSKLKKAFANLESGKVAAVITFKRAAEAFIKANGVTGVKVHAKALRSMGMYTFLNKKHEGIKAKLEKGLENIKASGEYDKIEASIMK